MPIGDFPALPSFRLLTTAITVLAESVLERISLPSARSERATCRVRWSGKRTSVNQSEQTFIMSGWKETISEVSPVSKLCKTGGFRSSPRKTDISNAIFPFRDFSDTRPEDTSVKLCRTSVQEREISLTEETRAKNCEVWCISAKCYCSVGRAGGRGGGKSFFTENFNISRKT